MEGIIIFYVTFVFNFNAAIMINYTYTVAERFLEYVKIDTQSNPNSIEQPSTQKQLHLSKVLVAQMLQMGIADAHLDEHGYVYGTLPSNSQKQVPTICFCSHVDTAPDCSGTNIVPILHTNYQGQDIVLPHDNTQIISPNKHKYLNQLIGHDIITASGLTLLGSDDKSGVAIIMDMANYLLQNSQVKHGEVKLLFTPDEEIGRGTAKVNIEKLGAQFAYTLDGGEAGSLEDETFSADAVKITIHGVITHPGYAKNKLKNALKIAAEILDALPKDALSPETTDKKEGFIHPTAVNGISEKATIEFIIRDFVTAGLAEKEAYLKTLAENIVAKYDGCTLNFEVFEQYRNMNEILVNQPHVAQYAVEAIEANGMTLIKESIRGGTDGSRLSFMGLPCPNIFTGMQAIHSKHEFISVQDMQKAVDTLVTLVGIWESKS
jgi:tripeptide aminopeptidase